MGRDGERKRKMHAEERVTESGGWSEARLE